MNELVHAKNIKAISKLVRSNFIGLPGTSFLRSWNKEVERNQFDWRTNGWVRERERDFITQMNSSNVREEFLFVVLFQWSGLVILSIFPSNANFHSGEDFFFRFSLLRKKSDQQRKTSSKLSKNTD